MNFEYNAEKITKHRRFIAALEQKMQHTPVDTKQVTLSFAFFTDQHPANAIIIYKPIQLSGPPYPTVLHISGTGYNTSTPYISHVICSRLAERSACQVIEISHRLAPEHPYPIGFNDVYALYKAIIRHAEPLHIDIHKLAISGYSSGGNFAALAAIQAKKDKLPLGLQILVGPITDLSRRLKRFKPLENKDNFPESLAQWFIDLYVQNHQNRKDPQLSPFYSDSIAGLAPTYFLYGEYDRFRSDSEAYADKLSCYGVWTHKSVFEKGQHDSFWYKPQVTDTMACQLQRSYGLFPVPKPLSSPCVAKKAEKSASIPVFPPQENNKNEWAHTRSTRP